MRASNVGFRKQTVLATNHGVYTGRTVDTIVRREYGRKAEARRSADPNSPHWGMVTHTDRYGAHVDATIKWVDTPEGDPPEHRMVFHEEVRAVLFGEVPLVVQWVTCPCPAGWTSSRYTGEDDASSALREEMNAHTGDDPDQTWCAWCGQPMTPAVGGDWITCPNAGVPEICTDCCGED